MVLSAMSPTPLAAVPKQIVVCGARLDVILSAASSTAKRALARASWEKRPIILAFRAEMKSDGTKPFTSPAIWQEYEEASKALM